MEEKEQASPPSDASIMEQAVAAMGGGSLPDEEAETAAPEPAAPAPEAPAPTEPQLTASEYFARLTAADQEKRNLKKQLEQAQAALKGQPGDVARLAQYRELAKKDPAKVMDALGLSLSEVLTAFAGPDDGAPQETQAPPQNEALSQLQQQIEALKQEIHHTKTETAIDRERKSLTEILATDDSPRWAYLRHNWSKDLADTVLHTAANLYAKTEQLPSYDAVMDMVEEHFVEQERSRLQGLSQREILAAKLGLLQQAPAQAPAKTPAPKSLGTSTPAAPAPKKLEELSDEDLLAEAVKAMQSA